LPRLLSSGDPFADSGSRRLDGGAEHPGIHGQRLFPGSRKRRSACVSGQSLQPVSSPVRVCSISRPIAQPLT
jgi:hypothetical protein